MTSSSRAYLQTYRFLTLTFQPIILEVNAILVQVEVALVIVHNVSGPPQY